MNKNRQRVFTVGDRAYLDSFAGLVAVRVTAVRDHSHDKSGSTSLCAVEAEVWMSKGPYQTGQLISSNALHIIPPGFIKKTKFATKILAGYRWKEAP